MTTTTRNECEPWGYIQRYEPAKLWIWDQACSLSSLSRQCFWNKQKKSAHKTQTQESIKGCYIDKRGEDSLKSWNNPWRMLHKVNWLTPFHSLFSHSLTQHKSQTHNQNQLDLDTDSVIETRENLQTSTRQIIVVSQSDIDSFCWKLWN